LSFKERRAAHIVFELSGGTPGGQNRVFVNSALKIQCHDVKKNTLTDCFFGDFAHWTVPAYATLKVFL